DCPKSHVSPSQKKTGVTAASTPKPVVPSAPVRAPPVADPSAIAGAGEKSCKFAGACTRPGCVFLHPWDVKGDPSATGGVPCRWAENCTRADCHFSHPPSRRTPFAAAGGKKAPFSAKNYTATFNNPKNPSIGAWPEEKPAHVSERLKRFNIQDGAEGEKIIPGQAKEEKLEIDLEGDGEGEAEEKVVEGSGVTA
ncbi:nuclear polyadenylated RNA-binding protein Nab2, partial [Pseudohyphozyma bogoriensis]